MALKQQESQSLLPLYEMLYAPVGEVVALPMLSLRQTIECRWTRQKMGCKERLGYHTQCKTKGELFLMAVRC